MAERRENCMKVIMVMVMSVDGKITKGNDPNVYNWTSKEDQAHFSSLIKIHHLIIMGRKTYEAASEIIEHSPEKLRIVLTGYPEKYSDVKGQLEFSKENPVELVKRLENKGYRNMLVVGGGIINAAFIKSKLVNELYLTIEPVLFGAGNSLAKGLLPNVKLKLLNTRKLNKKGTLLLHYQVDFQD